MFLPVEVAALPPLKLWRAISPEALEKAKHAGGLLREDSDRNWLAFKESVEEAADRASWDENVRTKDNMMMISLTVTSEDVGHFLRQQQLSFNGKYRAWRFYVDVPFLVLNEHGSTLLSIDQDVKVIQ